MIVRFWYKAESCACPASVSIALVRGRVGVACRFGLEGAYPQSEGGVDGAERSTPRRYAGGLRLPHSHPPKSAEDVFVEMACIVGEDLQLEQNVIPTTS